MGSNVLPTRDLASVAVVFDVRVDYHDVVAESDESNNRMGGG